jgi:hypothetical protein
LERLDLAERPGLDLTRTGGVGLEGSAVTFDEVIKPADDGELPR